MSGGRKRNWIAVQTLEDCWRSAERKRCLREEIGREKARSRERFVRDFVREKGTQENRKSGGRGGFRAGRKRRGVCRGMNRRNESTTDERQLYRELSGSHPELVVCASWKLKSQRNHDASQLARPDLLPLLAQNSRHLVTAVQVHIMLWRLVPRSSFPADCNATDGLPSVTALLRAEPGFLDCHWCMLITTYPFRGGCYGRYITYTQWGAKPMTSLAVQLSGP